MSHKKLVFEQVLNAMMVSEDILYSGFIVLFRFQLHLSIIIYTEAYINLEAAMNIVVVAEEGEGVAMDKDNGAEPFNSN